MAMAMAMDINSPAALRNHGASQSPSQSSPHCRLRDTANGIGPKPDIHLNGSSRTPLGGWLQDIRDNGGFTNALTSHDTCPALFFRAQAQSRCTNTCHSSISSQSKLSDTAVVLTIHGDAFGDAFGDGFTPVTLRMLSVMLWGRFLGGQLWQP
jgi:hypothetical protein